MTELEDLSLGDIVDSAGDALHWLYHAPLIELLAWAGGILLGLVVLGVLASTFEDRRVRREFESQRRRGVGVPAPSLAFKFGKALGRAMHRLSRP
jgi:hypothetical protein